MAKKKEKVEYKDLKKVKKMFEETKDEKSEIALSLIDKAIFLESTLKKLKDKIESDGVITEMCQGDYTIERENPALKSYNTTIKNFQATMKQITDLLENELEKNKKEDEIDDFDNFCDEEC